MGSYQVPRSDTLAGVEIDFENFFSLAGQHIGNSRDLPAVDDRLKEGLTQCIRLHIDKVGKLMLSTYRLSY